MHFAKRIFFKAAWLGAIAYAWPAAAGEKIPGNDEPTVKESRAHFRFSLAPKSLQRNPEVDFNVITEMTEYGAKLKKPTAKKPIYYVLQAGYYQNLGEAAPANAKPPPLAILQRAMKEALQKKGYLESEDKGAAPTLVIVFSYGDHSATNAEVETLAENAATRAEHELAAVERTQLEASLTLTDEQRDALPAFADSPDALPAPGSVLELLPYVLADRRKHQQVIERASLIGGVSFGKELAGVLKEEVSVRRTANATGRGMSALDQERTRQAFINQALGTPTDLPVGGPSSFQIESTSPFYRYYNRDSETRALIEDAFGSCYFVIASAYDGAAIAKGERRLLWRTKMTVNSSGVSMADTLPTLIRVASPHFGERMDKAVTVTKRVVRSGKAELGEEKVIDGDVSTAPATDGGNEAEKGKP